MKSSWKVTLLLVVLVVIVPLTAIGGNGYMPPI